MRARIVAISLCASIMFIAASGQGVSREPSSQEIAETRELMLQGNYDEAARRAVALSDKHPESPAGEFYNAVALIWKSYVDAPKLDAGSRAMDQEIERLLASAIKKAETIKARDTGSQQDEIEALYYLGSAYAIRSRLNFYQNHAIPAARYARTSQDHFDALLKLDRNYWDAYYASGSIYYRVGLLTDSPMGRVATTMLGAKSLPVGDRERGMNYLKTASEKGSFTSVDAKLALLEIYTFNESRFSDGVALARELQTKYPGNQTFARYLLKAHLGLKNRAEIQKTARQILALVKQGKPNFGAFMKAEAERALAESGSR
ncbi:MAG: hypothetical protein WBV94_01710 [Blastocatellia bacterium]